MNYDTKAFLRIIMGLLTHGWTDGYNLSKEAQVKINEFIDYLITITKDEEQG